ncbi:hypothetical protein BDV23DRAFT_26738 [Aspergillus alliaceus]|uniref:Uncharacterized protein n=1 Tax=Petromyces alliaceus TaxID=209559 RepID=A0A5N7BT26_PETAA|nr:hypothetical protein BDV23DRAFT_26738 [Aspergillus alliaceus]
MQTPYENEPCLNVSVFQFTLELTVLAIGAYRSALEYIRLDLQSRAAYSDLTQLRYVKCLLFLA